MEGLGFGAPGLGSVSMHRDVIVMLAHRDVPVVSYAPRPLRAMVSSLVIIGTVEDCNRTRTRSAQGELVIYMWGMQVSHQGGLTGARAAGAYVTGPVLNSLGVTTERRLKPCCSRGRRWRCCRRTYFLRDQRNVRGRRLLPRLRLGGWPGESVIRGIGLSGAL